MAQLKGKVAAITGTGSGIGRALAVALAQRGCALSISDVQQETLEETATLLKSYSVHVTTHIVDVSDKEAVSNYAKTTLQEHGHIDIVINNAGVALVDTVENMRYEDFEWLMNINFWGVVYGTKAFLPFLQQRKQSYIVNISSLFGLIAVPSQSAYNASKFAVRGFTEALRMECAQSPVSVSCVHPGGIQTNIVRSGRFRQSMQDNTTHEDLTHRFEQKMAATTAEQAAEIIIRGMLKKKSKILVGSDAKWLDRLQRWFPVGYQKIIQRFGR